MIQTCLHKLLFGHVLSNHLVYLVFESEISDVNCAQHTSSNRFRHLKLDLVKDYVHRKSQLRH